MVRAPDLFTFVETEMETILLAKAERGQIARPPILSFIAKDQYSVMKKRDLRFQTSTRGIRNNAPTRWRDSEYSPDHRKLVDGTPCHLLIYVCLFLNCFYLFFARRLDSNIGVKRL